MRRLLSIRTLALMMALSAAVAAHSYTLTNETLHYDIVYHWGLNLETCRLCDPVDKKIRI